METSLYNILSNGILAFINAYIYFVWVHTFYWSRRRYRSRRFVALFFLSIFCLHLARRFLLQHFATSIPLFTSWEPLFFLLDLLLLRLTFTSSTASGFLLLLFHHITFSVSYFAVQRTLTRLWPLSFNAGFPYTVRFTHEMMMLGIVVLVFYIGIILVSIFRRTKLQPRLTAGYVVGLLLPSILFCVGEVLTYPHMAYVENDLSALLIAAFLFLVNASVWLIHINLDWRNVYLYYLGQYYAEQERYYAQISEEGRWMRKRAHDERKHHIHILGLLQQKEYDKVEEYIQSLGTGTPPLGSLIITGNQDVDTVLNAKIAEAELSGCTLVISGKLPEMIQLHPVDCCILLGNCLDNAIEGCRESPELDTAIQVSFNYFRHLLLIRVQNACLPPDKTSPLAEKARELRQGKTAYGMGLEIMASVTQKYKGDISTRRDREAFTTEILLHDMPPAASERRLYSQYPASDHS